MSQAIATESAHALELNAVEKRYAGRSVLARVDLRVDSGAFFGLVGANGAGKTTCIKGLLDLCEIDAGCIRIFGRTHTSPASRARVTYLPERFLPPYYLKGRDFLRYMADLHGVERDEDAEREMLARLDLPLEALARPARTFSKGMAQKLGLAACFLSGKDLFVLDEPMSGLDPKARILVKRHLLGLREAGRTVFFSTHMLSDVAELCDCMAILHEGGVRFTGSPGECVERYAGAGLEDAYLRCIAAD